MGIIKLRKWDTVEHLKTEEDMVLYLQACMDEAGDDAAFIAASSSGITARVISCPRDRRKATRSNRID